MLKAPKLESYYQDNLFHFPICNKKFIMSVQLTSTNKIGMISLTLLSLEGILGHLRRAWYWSTLSGHNLLIKSESSHVHSLYGNPFHLHMYSLSRKAEKQYPLKFYYHQYEFDFLFIHHKKTCVTVWRSIIVSLCRVVSLWAELLPWEITFKKNRNGFIITSTLHRFNEILIQSIRSKFQHFYQVWSKSDP